MFPLVGASLVITAACLAVLAIARHAGRRMIRWRPASVAVSGALIVAVAIWSPGMLIPLGAIVVIGFGLARRDLRRLHDAQAVVHEYAEELARRRAQLVFERAFGVVDVAAWLRERELFLVARVEPKIGRVLPGGWLARRIEEAIEHAATQPIGMVFDAEMSPAEFERLIAQRLEALGWSSHVTIASGDQGVDVLAQKGDVRAVIQAKRYAAPAGVQAVQEAFTGRAVERADVGAVVASGGFTDAARRMANATGVLLLSPEQLDQLEKSLDDRHHEKPEHAR